MNCINHTYLALAISSIMLSIFLLVGCSSSAGVETPGNHNNAGAEVVPGPDVKPDVDPTTDDTFWWPAQQCPSSVVLCTAGKDQAEYMLAQSVAGLAAQAVNEGRACEMVFMEDKADADGKLYFDRMKAEKKFKVSGTFDAWELLERYISAGIVKGYVLYDSFTKGSASLNPATVAASVTGGVLVESAIEERVKSMGLSLLVDARQMSYQDCFNQYKDKLNRNLLVALEPKLGNIRDFAIAHKAFCIFGTGAFEEQVMQWLEPFSPIFGWNKGDEYVKTSLASKYAHFIVPSSLCNNISFYPAESYKVAIQKCKPLDPSKIDYDKKSSYHSFVMSDGDNFRYMTQNFIHNDEYWGNTYSKTIPVTWGTCPVMMVMGNPYAWNEIASEAVPGSLLEFGGGYHYPDEFASKRADRDQLQRKFAKMIGKHCNTSGVKIIGNIYKDRNSPEAQKAMQVFAEEIDGLVGLVALSYNPYEDGKGEIRWVKNKKGIDIPVLYPKYSLWAGTRAPYKGNPDKISNFINKDAAEGQNLNASMIHAWSHYVKNSDGSVSDADKNDPNSCMGVEPVQWTKEKINSKTEIIPLEELLWRIRMKYREEQTTKLLGIIK